MTATDTDRALTEFAKVNGLDVTDELRTVFAAGFHARGELDARLANQKLRGGWVLPPVNEGYNFAVRDIVRAIRKVN